MEKNRHLFKIILVGNTGVGKTSILKYLDKGKKVDINNNNDISTIGIDFVSKVIENEKNIIKLQIWDTSGQERFRSITNNYFRGAHSCLLVFSLSNKESFRDIINWYKEYKSYEPSGNTILVGSKNDLEREIKTDEINELCKRYNFIYREASSVTGIGIKDLFELICNIMTETQGKEKTDEIKFKVNDISSINEMNNKCIGTSETHFRCTGIRGKSNLFTYKRGRKLQV